MSKAPGKPTPGDLVKAVIGQMGAPGGPASRPVVETVESALLGKNYVNSNSFDTIRDALVAVLNNADPARLELREARDRTDTPHAKLADLLDRALADPERPTEVLAPPGYLVWETFLGVHAAHSERVKLLEVDCDQIQAGASRDEIWPKVLKLAATTEEVEGIPPFAAYNRLRERIAESGRPSSKGPRLQPVLRKLDRYMLRTLRELGREGEKPAGDFLLDVAELGTSTLIFGTMTLRAYMGLLKVGSPTYLSYADFPLCENWEAWSCAKAGRAAKNPKSLRVAKNPKSLRAANNPKSLRAAKEPESLIGKLNELSKGHPEAFARGLTHAKPPKPDLDAMAAAVRRVHSETAKDLLDLVAPACREVLTTSAWINPADGHRDPLEHLALSRVLRPVEGRYEPMVDGWSEFWGEGR